MGPLCRPRLATALGKGSYVKVVDRGYKQGKKMTIVGSVGTQREKSDVYNLDISSLVAVRAPRDDADSDEEANLAAICSL